MKKLFFVYGTLKSGFYNNSIMGDSKSIGEAVTVNDGFTMYDGGFPYTVPEGNFKIKGEVFEVTSPVVERNLDRLEGVPSHFCRHETEVRLSSTGEVVPVQMYVASPRTAKFLSSEKHRPTIIPDDNNICVWKE